MGLLKIAGSIVFGTEEQHQEWRRKRIQNRNTKEQKKALDLLNIYIEKLKNYENGGWYWSGQIGDATEEQLKKYKAWDIERVKGQIAKYAWADPNFDFKVIQDEPKTESLSDIDKQIKMLELQKEIELLKASNSNNDKDPNSRY